MPGYCEQGASEHSPVYEAASFSCAGTVPSLALASCLAPAFSLSICLDSVFVTAEHDRRDVLYTGTT